MTASAARTTPEWQTAVQFAGPLNQPSGLKFDVRVAQDRYVVKMRRSSSPFTFRANSSDIDPFNTETIHAQPHARALAPRSTLNSFPSNVRSPRSCAGYTQLRSAQIASRYSVSFGRKRSLFSRHSAVASVCAFAIRALNGI